jgi:hypothetical protein
MDYGVLLSHLFATSIGVLVVLCLQRVEKLALGALISCLYNFFVDFNIRHSLLKLD